MVPSTQLSFLPCNSGLAGPAPDATERPTIAGDGGACQERQNRAMSRHIELQPQAHHRAELLVLFPAQIVEDVGCSSDEGNESTAVGDRQDPGPPNRTENDDVDHAKHVEDCDTQHEKGELSGHSLAKRRTVADVRGHLLGEKAVRKLEDDEQLGENDAQPQEREIACTAGSNENKGTKMIGQNTTHRCVCRTGWWCTRKFDACTAAQ